MSVTRIASRYAKSLLDLAQEQNKLDRVLEDVETFQQATEQRDFFLLLKSPIVNPDKKGTILKEIFSEKFDELTMAFVNIVLRKGREGYLPDIAKEFITQYRSLKHISTVKVTTATALSEASLAAIKQQLQGSDKTEANIEIVTEVNPNLIGGFVIEFDDKLYDASVAHKLSQLKKEFSGNQYVNNM
ncbi:MAG: ATP synthase F1 subunit delta [Bacteroidota bacterium]